MLDFSEKELFSFKIALNFFSIITTENKVTTERFCFLAEGTEDKLKKQKSLLLKNSNIQQKQTVRHTIEFELFFEVQYIIYTFHVRYTINQNICDQKIKIPNLNEDTVLIFIL